MGLLDALMESGKSHVLMNRQDESVLVAPRDLQNADRLQLISLVVKYLVLCLCAWWLASRARRWFLNWVSAWTVGRGRGRGEGVGGGSKWARKKRTCSAPPLLLHRETERNHILVERTAVLRRPYVPSPWLNHDLGGHMQSFMFATWCPPSDCVAVSRLVSRKEIIASSFDGGTFRLDWFDVGVSPLPADAPVVFVLPGVVGQGTNVYVRHLAAHLAMKYGWRVVAKSWRGIGSHLTTRRPETWDHVALSDARDSVRHVRATIGHDVPLMGVGFSFGGFLLTALAGSVPREEHGFCGIVTISGLFDMSSMMDHIAAQYIHSYASANTRVTVRNYQKFKVLETLTSAGDVATADFINPSGTCSRAPECPGASENAAAGACGAAATSNDAAAAVSTASTASAVGVGVTPVCRSVAKPVEGSNVVSLASPVAARKNCCSSVPGSPGRVGGGGGPGVVEVKAKDLAKMTHPIAFHEGLTLPFTGDSSVEAYYERIEEIMSPYIEAVDVPALALLARDDPLCPPMAWEGALKRAAKSNGIIVAITDKGGHCGWFDGLGAGSWVDRAAGDFLANALELRRDELASSGANNSTTTTTS